MDQRGIDDQRRARRTEKDEGYLDSAEAIAILGVKRETLYAYASRGLVRSVPGPRGRPRLYARADVERLRTRHDARAGHAAVAADALRFGEPVLDSAITEVTPRGPKTRGLVLAEAAAEGRSIEEVAEIVWASGRGLEAWAESRRDAELDRALAVAATAIVPARQPRLLDRLVIANAALGVMDADRFVTTIEAELARARRVMRLFARSLALPDRARARSSPGSIVSTTLRALGLRDEPAARHAIQAILVALADHELNASTFAARVAASAGADLYACVGA
ncbi:MAG: citrate synthase, partial [Deltaproteobacteria bacterium]|nr:citrate synthase [Deltaproteobacteria bacterium]